MFEVEIQLILCHSYSKTEDIQDYSDYLQYTHLIHGNTTLLEELKENFKVIKVIESYDRLQKFPPAVIIAPKVWIMKKITP